MLLVGEKFVRDLIRYREKRGIRIEEEWLDIKFNRGEGICYLIKKGW